MLNPFTHRKVLKKGMPGQATIVEMGALDRGGTSFNLPMTLQVFVEGITPYEVEDQWMVKAKDTVGLSGSIPVQAVTPTIDMRNDPELRRKIEQVLGRELTPGTSETIAENDPELQMRIMQVLQEHAAQRATGFASPGTGSGGDDTVGQLERLAALRDSGALTEEEFEREKKKLLGG